MWDWLYQFIPAPLIKSVDRLWLDCDPHSLKAKERKREKRKKPYTAKEALIIPWLFMTEWGQSNLICGDKNFAFSAEHNKLCIEKWLHFISHNSNYGKIKAQLWKNCLTFPVCRLFKCWQIMSGETKKLIIESFVFFSHRAVQWATCYHIEHFGHVKSMTQQPIVLDI